MMKKILQYLAFALGVLLLLAGAGVAGLYAWTAKELKVTVADPTHDFVAPSDSASITRGEHVTRALAKCADCHGADYGGLVMVDDAPIGRLVGPNITSGRGGVVASWTDADFERAIRHGVAKDGRRLVFMPSHEYQLLSDEDVGVIIAYLRTVAPVDREMPSLSLGPVARGLYAAGKMPWFPAISVTHRSEVVASVVPDSTAEYGRYLASGGCSGCHGANYSGGPIAGAPPDWPAASNITPTGLAWYDYAAFVKALTEGVRPDGSALHPVMPVQATKLMTPLEMTALWKYMQTVSPAETGTR